MWTNQAEEGLDTQHRECLIWSEAGFGSEAKGPVPWARQSSHTSQFVLPSLPSPSSKRKTKPKTRAIPNLKKCSHAVRNPHLYRLCLHRGIQQIQTGSKPENRQQSKTKNVPCLSDAKESVPHYSVLSSLTKEVTSTQKPRSHPAAPQSPAKEKDCLGCSISTVIKGRVRKERKSLHFIPKQPHFKFTVAEFKVHFGDVLYSTTHEASRRKAIFYPLEAFATPLPCCSELLGIIQTEQERTNRVQEGSSRAFRAAAWLGVWIFQTGNIYRSPNSPGDVWHQVIVTCLEGESWLRITSKSSWFALSISSLWYFVSGSVKSPLKEKVHFVLYKRDRGVGCRAVQRSLFSNCHRQSDSTGTGFNTTRNNAPSLPFEINHSTVTATELW